MLFLCSFELCSRWVPLLTGTQYNVISPLQAYTHLILPRYSAISEISQFHEREFHSANYYNNPISIK